MGVKRPLDENRFQEPSSKQAKQLDGCNKSTEIAEDSSPHEASLKAAILRKFDGKVGESDFGGELEDDKADKELETSATSSWITSSSSEEESGNGGAFFLPLYPDFFELNLPTRTPIHFEDAYTFLFNSSPRKEVPVGPDHQADIPEWDPDIIRKNSLGFGCTADDDIEKKLVGTSIIAMPDSIVSSCDDINIGHGRMDCDCSDEGSIRCVRQHVKEARERLRESIGEEKFADLGFLDKGEEVALKWTDEEERVFHDVVYSNPISLGKNFWKHLSVAFPSRTKMELVSYYFNVFILHRRAVQNRSDFLDIDSDDDEWQGDGRFPRVGGEDDVSVVESFGDEDLHVDHEIGASYEIDDDNGNVNGNENNDNDNNDRDDHGDRDVGTNGQHAMEKCDLEEQMSRQPATMSKVDSGFGFDVKNTDKAVSSNSQFHDTQAGTYSGRPVAEDNTIRENVHKSEKIRCPEGINNGTGASGTGFISDLCDAKAWDDTFLTSHVKNTDLLPTRSMIEEIFGPCTWKSN